MPGFPKDPLVTFTRRLQEEWLPAFCDAPHRKHPRIGFREESIAKLSEYDAYWFLVAVDSGLVEESDGFFWAPRSMAREQIFWTGSKKKNPRPLTLWIEPIITIGALARLTREFGWPIDQLGMQSKTWAFDLVGYRSDFENEQLVCEVKKDFKEISVLLEYVKYHSAEDPLGHEPIDSKERNAYRKVQGIRNSWPYIFWALGPQDYGEVFSIQRQGNSDRFFLQEMDKRALKYGCA